MAEFAYNNAKNISIGHTSFELNYNSYLWMLNKDEVNSHSKSKSADKLSIKLRELMIVCQENLYYVQNLQKRAHDKGIKPKSYTSGDKI